MKKVMVRAWEIAKEGVKKFGGKVKEYFAQALRMAWAEVKKGANTMQVHKWVTVRGAQAELHAEHITLESRTTDWGEIIEKEVNRVSIHKVIVNGKVFNGLITREKVEGTEVLNLGVSTIRGEKKKMYLPLPADVIKAVWGKYEEIKVAKEAKRAAREKAEAETLKKKVAHGYCPKCDSYCWGDCSN